MLLQAILDQDLSKIKEALAEGANPNQIFKRGLRSKASFSVPYVDDIPALVLATCSGNLEAMTLLLDAGASPNAQCASWHCYPFSDDEVEFEEQTALCVAAENGHLSGVQLLLDRGANPNTFSALCFAAQKGHLDIVKALMKAGARPSLSNHDMTSSLSFALQNGFVEVADFIYQEGGRFYSERDIKEAKKKIKQGKYRSAKKWMSQYSELELLGN